MQSKKQKADLLDQIKEKLSRSKMIMLAEYQGMTVEQISELRRKLKTSCQSEYKVYKNTFVRKALDKDNPLLSKEDLLSGPNGLIFSYGDPASTAKVVSECAGKFSKLKIKAGVLQNRLLSAADIDSLSKLPSRDILLAQVLGTMQAPITGFVTVCSGVIRGFVNCVSEIKKQKEAQA
ncbi:MAG: 50S ribosomal protein L10 [Candidatus Wallbacteria bacterium]|nr:50S ribosomal protein L10 [Candidatus Wallbacteria bacterium]